MSRPKQSTLVIPPGDDPGGETPFERFDNIMKRILSTPKKEADEKTAEWRRKREKRKS
jgi:hypothetical protein